MTVLHPRPLLLLTTAIAAICLVAGCKSKDGGSRDPLVHGPRIPKQNLPLPDRDAIGVKGPKTDPLLDRPVGRGKDKNGHGYSDDPERFQGVFVPGENTSPAALASKWNDGDELKLDAPDGRVPLRPATGDVKPAGGVATGSDSLRPLYQELEKYGATRNGWSLRQDNGRHVFRASVPISGSGAKRQYEGIGATAEAAVKQVLDQVIADRQ
jgi:hypothetical protein